MGDKLQQQALAISDCSVSVSDSLAQQVGPTQSMSPFSIMLAADAEGALSVIANMVMRIRITGPLYGITILYGDKCWWQSLVWQPMKRAGCNARGIDELVQSVATSVAVRDCLLV